MGMKSDHGGGGPRLISEINVTPLVDVMLVLLIIFMVAAGVQTLEVQQERQDVIEEAEQLLEEARQIHAEGAAHRKVGVDLPKVDSEAVNLNEVKKLKLQMDHRLVFSIGDRVLVDCLDLSPEMKKHLGRAETAEEARKEAEAFSPCLKRLGERLVDNAKLQQDKELYVLADRRLDYGKVLRVMAVVRQAGVTRFGLVAEPGLLEGATVEPTPEVVP
jgi:biopolymer transport protein TolR